VTAAPGTLAGALARAPRARLATLPTPLERGPELPGGARLWVKRDDLTGLGMGGNKVRKLERLCGAALADGADVIVTVGAAQSNHCRQTAAAGAVLGLPVHLVLGGDPPPSVEGNQALSVLFGAELHFAGTSRWEELEATAGRLVEDLRAQGRRPAAIPIGGSTPTGAVGFAEAWAELLTQCDDSGIAPAAVVHATSSGGTHAGLLAGRAALLAEGAPGPPVLAVAVAPGVAGDPGLPLALAQGCLASLDLDPGLVTASDVELETGALGPGYAAPTAAADEAIRWAARTGGWVLDRTYTGKGLAGLLALATAGRWGPGDHVVFWHTGGQPAVFARAGLPLS
jgi:1-aminocyclopropane-1-carboxylate deaminase/D-cysteine desulfhydrase-like pyridoxal-dependent ACC family enzyme